MVFLMEAASHRGFKHWYKNVHVKDISTFGESGEGHAVAKHFGFSTDYIIEEVKSILKK